MGDALIPPEMERFLLAYIHSVAHIEGLLLLRSAPDAAWTARSLAARLFVTPAEAGRVLGDLTTYGFMAEREGHGEFTYAPASPELDAMVGRVETAYRTQLVAVTKFIHDRQKASSIQQFADAFKLRKD